MAGPEAQSCCPRADCCVPWASPAVEATLSHYRPVRLQSASIRAGTRDCMAACSKQLPGALPASDREPTTSGGHMQDELCGFGPAACLLCALVYMVLN